MTHHAPEVVDSFLQNLVMPIVALAGLCFCVLKALDYE